MPLVITPEDIFLGAGQPYYRAVGVLSAWTGVGATTDDTAMRINQSWYRPELNGMLAPIQGMDYLNEQNAELEFTMNEIAGTKLSLAVPGATTTTTATTDQTTPAATTLASAAIIGDSALYVVAITGFVVGDYVRVNASGASAEYRQIDVIGTAGARGIGTGLQFRDPLQKAHNSGVAVTETVGDGKTETTGSTVRRMPESAYRQWILVAESPRGYQELKLDSGISVTDTAEVTTGDETMGGIRTTIQSRNNGATPNTPAWRIRNP